MNTIIKHYSQLSKDELYRILQLRAIVFVVEQECPYLDVDDLDIEAYHIMLYDKERNLKAYCRIIPPGLKFDENVCISRVVSHPDVRRFGWGRSLMTTAIKTCEELYPFENIEISAQLYLKEFYSSFGFAQITEMYLEDNIPHIGMLRKIYNEEAQEL